MAVDGKYDVIIDASVARQKAVLELKTDGTNVGGTLLGAMDLKFTDGGVSGNNVSWKMEGQIAAIYPTVYKWDCTATVDGDTDTITGMMKLGAVVGDAPFHGTRVGVGSGHGEVAVLHWKDMGLPRYEAISVDWVKAMCAYMKKKVQRKKVDFELSWMIKYNDPPSHLLRGHGPNMIAYHMVFRNGDVDVFDGPVANPDVTFIYPYYPFAPHLRMNTDDYIKWVQAEGAQYVSKVSNAGDLTKMPLINGIVAGPGNDIREEFLSQQTA